MSILLGNGDGSFGTRVAYLLPSSPGSMSTGDFNGDGKLDLIVAIPFSDTLYLMLGNGDGTFQAPVSVLVPPSFDESYSVTTADFNGDGKLDLAIATNTNTISIMLGNGDGAFQPPIAYSTDPYTTLVVLGVIGDN